MTTPKLSKARAIEKLRQQLEGIPRLRQQPSFSADFTKWQRDTSVAIERIFGSKGRHVKDFGNIRYSLSIVSSGTPDSAFEEAFRDGLDTARPILESFIDEVQEYWPDDEEAGALPPPRPLSAAPFVAPERLAGLRKVGSTKFDLARLVRLLEEIDLAFGNGSYHAVAALTRAVLDHVPPIFSLDTFAEVANNYSGSKSFRHSMQHLENSARRIGDAHLHTQVRRRESLPTAAQVNFSNDLDVLLAEVTRLLS